MSNRSDSGEKKRNVFFRSVRQAFSSRKSAEVELERNGAAAESRDAPPAYSPVDVRPTTSSGPAQQQQPAPSSSAPASVSFLSPYRSRGSGFELSSEDISSSTDPYVFLSKFDTVFLIDDSSSMSTGNRWEEVKSVLYQVVPLCVKHDQDGIDIFFLNNPAEFRNVNEVTAVEQIFKSILPSGMTPTGTRISQILTPYLENYTRKAKAKGPKKTGVKPLNLIVITDGAPNDSPQMSVPRVLQRIAKSLDEVNVSGVGAPMWQVGVQFFQVGNDPLATQSLQELDDDLGGKVARGGLRDIVDTCTFDAKDGRTSMLTSEGVLKTVLGAVVKRFDAQVLIDQRSGRA